jgi:hypothetical protein
MPRQPTNPIFMSSFLFVCISVFTALYFSLRQDMLVNKKRQKRPGIKDIPAFHIAFSAGRS